MSQWESAESDRRNVERILREKWSQRSRAKSRFSQINRKFLNCHVCYKGLKNWSICVFWKICEVRFNPAGQNLDACVKSPTSVSPWSRRNDLLILLKFDNCISNKIVKRSNLKKNSKARKVRWFLGIQRFFKFSKKFWRDQGETFFSSVEYFFWRIFKIKI